MSERRRITFSGHVQGVGFRMTAIHLAQDLPLSGTVENLPDGDVEIVLQGASADIDTLVESLREQFGSYVRNMTQVRTNPLSLPGDTPKQGIRVIY